MPMREARSAPLRTKKVSHEPAALLVAASAILTALIFLVYPLANTVLAAFLRHDQEFAFSNLTLENFERFFISKSYQRAFVNSIVTSAGATALAVLLSVPMAYAVARTDIRHRSLIMALSVIPLIAPPFIGAYAWVMLLGNNGMLTQILVGIIGVRPPAIYGVFGVTIALALSYFPYAFLMIQAAFVTADPAIEEAARMAGASQRRIFRTITLPLVAPAIAAGMLVVFVKSIGDFGVPSILGGELQVLPTLIYYQIHGFFNLNAGSAIALVNVLLTGILLAALAILNRRWSFATVTGTARATHETGSRWFRLAAAAYVWGVLVLALLPQAVVALYSFSERWGDSLLPTEYGIANYAKVAGDSLPTVANSLILSAVATFLCLVFGATTAYAMVRGKAVARWAIDLTIMLPFVLPGLVVGVAFLTAFNQPPLLLTGTAAILVLAYFTRRVAFVFRSATTAIGQVDRSMEEASRICGASWIDTMRRVLVPLIAPALIASGMLVFATLIGEISATVLLFSARWKPMSIAIYELVLGNELAKASALGTICNVLTLGLLLVASRLAGRSISDMFR